MTTKSKKSVKNETVNDDQQLAACPSKVCQVCSDKALGHNFNAITCESCKAFFRRNALSSKEFTCPFRTERSENCEITVVTRRFCQKCRLEKCFSIGMKKEYIMSDVDKQIKRDKVEQNRAKKRQKGSKDEHGDLSDVVNSPDTTTSLNGDSPGSLSLPKCLKLEKSTSEDTTEPAFSSPFTSVIMSATPTSTTTEAVAPIPLDLQPMPTVESTASEIVQRIIGAPHQAAKVINSLMTTPENAVFVMSKIISSQAEALALINHFILAPGDALQVLSKIMNSPLDALTVFTQFMSSPVDSLQIISKVMSSPNDVLDFIQHLMATPEHAIDIMQKFMSSPAEALQIINRMMNNREVPDSYNESRNKKPVTAAETVPDAMIKSILYANGMPMASKPSETDEVSWKAAGEPQGVDAFDTTRDVIEAIENKAIELGSFESLIYQAIKIEYDGFNSNAAFSQPSASTTPSQPASVGGASGPSTSRDLNDGERAKLNELIVANKALYAPVDEDLTSLLSDNCGIRPDSNEANTPLLRVINLTAIAIRRLIKMSKKINSFKNMCQEDQIALLKGGCIEMMILRSVMQYDFDRDTWKIPHSQEEMSNIKADVLKLAKGNIYEEHERFIQTFEKSWRTDENIILILCAIVLFTPDRPKTVHCDVIKLEQNSYYYLLRRYLESVYAGCEAKSTFLKLIKKINELHKLNKEMISVYLNVNPAQVEPLLREIFDLKVHSSV